MKCNIIRLEDRKQVKKQCFKTKHKHFVIAKLEEGNYSITHYKTGIAIGLKNYTTVKEALLDLDNVINDDRKYLKNRNITFKQFCKQNNLKQINF